MNDSSATTFCFCTKQDVKYKAYNTVKITKIPSTKCTSLCTEHLQYMILMLVKNDQDSGDRGKLAKCLPSSVPDAFTIAATVTTSPGTQESTGAKNKATTQKDYSLTTMVV